MNRVGRVRLLESYYPYEYVESVFAIDYAKLYELGYRGVIFDIDNTLVPHGADSTPEVDDLFRRIHATGLKTLLLSDNSQERIERFCANIDTPYICDAGKPDPAPFLKGVEMLGLEKGQVVCVGDQVFSDIKGANAAGIGSILVKYIGYYEPGGKGKKRWLEARILDFYRRSRLQHRIGDIANGEC